MNDPILDISFLLDLSGGEPEYVVEVVGIFLDTIPDKVSELRNLITNTANYDEIRKLSHFLKSSANIIKIRNMHENVSTIEHLAKAGEGIDEMQHVLINLLSNFNEAIPLLKAEMQHYQSLINPA